MSDNKTKELTKNFHPQTSSTIATLESRAQKNDTPAGVHLRVSQEFLGGRFDIKG